MNSDNEISFVAPSLWEDLADSWNALFIVLIALAGAYKFIDIPEFELWLYIFIGALCIVFLYKIQSLRNRYAGAYIRFSEYPPQRGREFNCEIHFPELFEVDGAAMVELHKSKFDGSGGNDHMPYWAEARTASVRQESDETIFAFDFIIPKKHETTHHYYRWWEPWKSELDGKWKLIVKAKRKDKVRFPRRRYIEVWD